MNQHWQALQRSIQRCDRRFSHFDGESRIWLGLETRHGGDPYRWEGLKRAHASREFIVQCTLAGEGRYALN